MYKKRMGNTLSRELAALAQIVACLPLVHLKIFNFGARRGGDVHFLIARLYTTVLD